MNNSEKSQIGDRLRWFVMGAALGAISTYYLDPAQGRHRRMRTRDKTMSLLNRTGAQSGKFLRNWRNRFRGLMLRTSAPITESTDTSDETLMNRVRSKLGRIIRHTRTIKVEVRNGAIILSGPVLAGEVDAIVRCAQEVPGVRSVENRLAVHASAADFSRPPGYLQ